MIYFVDKVQYTVKRFNDRGHLMASFDLPGPVEEKFAEHCAPDFWLDEILERVTIYHGV